MTNRASQRSKDPGDAGKGAGSRSGSANRSGTKGGLTAFSLRLALRHPARVLLVLGVAAAILAFPLRDRALELFGWSAAPLGIWTVGALCLFSWRPAFLFRRWRYLLPLLLLAFAASGVLGMMNAGPGSGTGDSLGGNVGIAISVRPYEWDRFNVTTLEYVTASLRVAVLVIAAIAIFIPRTSWKATAIGSRYSWRGTVLTGRAAARARRKWSERMERRRAERVERAAQLEFELAAAEAALTAQAESPSAVPLNKTGTEIVAVSPTIHGLTAGAASATSADITGTPPWKDLGEDEEDLSTDPMETELVLRELPGSSDSAGPRPLPAIVSTAVLSQAASQFSWPLPRLDMLKRAPSGGVTRSEIDDRSALIENSLAEYGIDVTVDQVFTGPTVTMYGLKPGWKGGKVDPASGKRVRVDMILNREKDLALALASPNIRFEPVVPGESVVGIEVPNSRPTPVTLRSVMETEAWRQFEAKAQLPVPLGLGSGGQPVFADLARMPHTLIAGATGSGKSVCMNAIITGLLMCRTPAQVRLVMIDPKRVELTPYAGVPHLYTQVVVEADRAVATLKALIAEMMGRFRVLEKAGVKNIVSFNERSKEKMPYLVILVDELADLMLQAANEVERLLVRLAQLGRATGVHLVVATQRPSVDVVTGLIKANFPSRISFAVMSQIDSRTVLDSTGGEKLLGRGDMLYLPIDKAKAERVQGAFLSDAEIESTVRMWKAVRGPSLPELEVEMEDEATVDTEFDGSSDSLVDSARNLARLQKTLSTSLLQRRLRIGYPRAARLMDELEDLGVVGPGEPGKPRHVLGS
ncbi:MAG: DNA translocase FtsK [Chloroflexi bacterium]|nr:DNA translocase FtsK [Chloroflexota bacterium]